MFGIFWIFPETKDHTFWPNEHSHKIWVTNYLALGIYFLVNFFAPILQSFNKNNLGAQSSFHFDFDCSRVIKFVDNNASKLLTSCFSLAICIILYYVFDELYYYYVTLHMCACVYSHQKFTAWACVFVLSYSKSKWRCQLQ